MSIYDVVIVGAGAAGLAAAKTARRAGLRTAVLEAGARIGGRAQTDHTTFGVPFDRGCAWLHSASVNPLRELAISYGFTVHARTWRPLIHSRDGWLDDGCRDEALAYLGSSFEAMSALGSAGEDVACSEALDGSNRWSGLLELWFTAIMGTAPADYSTLAAFQDADTNENWPIEEGYGALIARYGAGVEVTLQTPVDGIDWTTGELKLHTPRGTIRSRTAIVTASTGVLADGAIGFEPTLPDWKRDAIAAFPMGKANKIALAFDRNVLDLPADSYVVSTAGLPDTVGFHVRPFGHQLAIGYVAGRYCSELERAGPDAMKERAVEELCSMFGSEVRSAVIRSATTAWESEPFIRGAYSTARPGQAAHRTALAAPLADRLYFAGEATSPSYFSTAHGAYLSGIAAAEAVIDQLGAVTKAG